MTKPIPDGFNSVSAHMTIKGCAEAIKFYEKAFGAMVASTMLLPGTDQVLHASIQIGNSTIMMADEMPMMEHHLSPPSLGGTTVALSIYTEDADALYNQAVEAGAKPIWPISDAFWGDRYGKVRDPFGHDWEICTHKVDLTPEQIAEGAKEFFANMAKAQG